MTTEEAIRRCDFWTTDIAETKAIGTTSDALVGLHFNGEEYAREYWTNRERRGWAITISRWVTSRDEEGEVSRAENLAYTMIVQEIERRKERDGP